MRKFELTSEILHYAAQCETVEEILTKAKEYVEDITMEEAQRIFELSHAQNGAISDEELDSVAGGQIVCSGASQQACPYCENRFKHKENGIKEHILKHHPEKWNEYLAKHKSC